MNHKIIHITLGKANPNRMNGVNKVVSSLISAQIEEGNDAELWGISFSSEHNYPKRNFKTYLFKDSKFKFNLNRKLKLKIFELRKHNNCVVHLHGVFLPQLYQISRLLVKFNIPYIFTPHGGYNLKALEKSKFIKLIYINLFEKKIVNRAKAIHIIGKSENQGLKKHFNPKKVDLVPNGQNSLGYESKKEFQNKILHLGYMGRIDIEGKGLNLLIEAVALLKNKIDLKLSIIGDGGEIVNLQKMISKYNLEDQITLEGALYSDAKYRLLRKLDALCLISRNEGLPGVVLEAAAVGTPSIISKETNLVNYIETYEAGWHINKNTSESLAQTINQVFLEKERSSLVSKSENSLNMIQLEFPWSTIARKLNLVYA